MDPVQGLLYLVLMLTAQVPNLIEFTWALSGDPECQEMMLRLMSATPCGAYPSRDGN